MVADKAEGQVGFERRPVSLSQVLASLVARFKPLAEGKGLWLKYFGLGDELVVHGDWVELYRIVHNLLSNAVKYTQKGGVKVLAERSKGSVRITVADTGMGIPAREQLCLFHEFFRASNARASGESGIGLGLAIVKDLVESYGGQILVESREGVGTCVIVLLPLMCD
jgi:signal transduction histidine kinase